jgi:hypothetical protein
LEAEGKGGRNGKKGRHIWTPMPLDDEIECDGDRLLKERRDLVMIAVECRRDSPFLVSEVLRRLKRLANLTVERNGGAQDGRNRKEGDKDAKCNDKEESISDND